VSQELRHEQLSTLGLILVLSESGKTPSAYPQADGSFLLRSA